MVTFLEKIEKLSTPTGREKELVDIAKDNRNRLPTELSKEFRYLENNRVSELNKLKSEAWIKLKELKYKRVQYQSNPALESGHSDYDDPSDRVSFLGIQTPDGRFIDGGHIWEGALLPAIKDAGI